MGFVDTRTCTMLPSRSPSSSYPPEGTEPQASTDAAAEVRKYVSHACEACRSRRSKVESDLPQTISQDLDSLQCDGQLPICTACSRRRTLCAYSEVDRRRGKLKKNETDALQEKVKALESIIEVLSIGSDDEARDLLESIRGKQALTASGVAQPVADALAQWHNSRKKDVEFNPSVRTNLICTKGIPYSGSSYVGAIGCVVTLLTHKRPSECTQHTTSHQNG